MRFRLFPKEHNFFDLFEKQVDIVVEGATFFKEIVSKGTLNQVTLEKMRTLEHDADGAAHAILNQLDKTFITPFDREDIHALANELDDVIDQIDTIVNRMMVYRLTSVNATLVEFASVIEEAVLSLSKAVKGLRDTRNAQAISQNCVEVNRLENVSDDMRDAALGNLFDTEKDAIVVMKWREIYQDAEKVVDQCEDAAHIVQSILVKQA
jgi:uncharacterized protein Yka (UPF0111/DUF47 family)